MKLIIAEKHAAARQIAERLSTGKPKKDKVYNTAIYRIEWKGEECVTIGLADTLMVSSVGEAAVSGVSLVDSFNTLMIQIMSALATGGAVVASQYIGHREPKNAKAAAATIDTVK